MNYRNNRFRGQNGLLKQTSHLLDFHSSYKNSIVIRWKYSLKLSYLRKNFLIKSMKFSSDN